MMVWRIGMIMNWGVVDMGRIADYGDLGGFGGWGFGIGMGLEGKVGLKEGCGKEVGRI